MQVLYASLRQASDKLVKTLWQLVVPTSAWTFRYDAQAAQQVARRTIRDERSRASQFLAETHKKFEEREAVALAKFEQMGETWKTER